MAVSICVYLSICHTLALFRNSQTYKQTVLTVWFSISNIFIAMYVASNTCGLVIKAKHDCRLQVNNAAIIATFSS